MAAPYRGVPEDGRLRQAVTGCSEIVAGLIRAFNLIAGWARDNRLRRQGAEKAQLDSLKTRQQLRSKADAIDNAPVSDSDSERDILKRL